MSDCTAHPSVDYLFRPLTRASIARMRTEAGADLARMRAQRASERQHTWSRLWERCQVCLTATRPHATRGHCSVCWNRRLRAEKRGEPEP